MTREETAGRLPLAWLQANGRQLMLCLSEREPWPAVLATVAARLEGPGAPHEGAEVVVELGARPVPKYELASLVALLSRRGIAIRAVRSESQTTQQSAAALSLNFQALAGGNAHADGFWRYPDAQLPLIPEQAGMPALYVPDDIAAGQRVYSRGNLVVGGDVETDGQLIAVGDILVWGRLMGMAHAGIEGNQRATVRALGFSAQKIEIGNILIEPAVYQDAHGPAELSLWGGQGKLTLWTEAVLD